MYAGGNSSVKLGHGTTQRFLLERGIRQGCPASVYLFLIVAQAFCHFIKDSNLEGIHIAGRSILISQLADDTALFLKNSSQVHQAIKNIQLFSNASGLYLNIKKCEILVLKKSSLLSVDGIPVKETVNYLGVVISKSEQDRVSLNFNPAFEKIKSKFNLWLLRDLSLRGRVLLSKAEGISRRTYCASYM